MVEKTLFERRNDIPRRHADLTDPARSKLALLIKDHRILYTHTPLKKLKRRVSPSRIEANLNTSEWSDSRNSTDVMQDIVREDDTLIVFSAFELLLNENNNADMVEVNNPKKKISQISQEIQNILDTEGILWDLVRQDDTYQFQELGESIKAKEAEEEFRELFEGSEFEKALRPYNSAVELFKEKKYGKEIPEKLYNSIEETVKTICVDLENWEDNRERNLGHYLEILRDKGILGPNNKMKPELERLSEAMELTFQKSGDDRKNRHSHIDRRYSNLLIHQTSSFLAYIVHRYKENG